MRKASSNNQSVSWSRFVLAALLTMSFWVTASAQDAQLTGTISDQETGETLPGATVILVGTYKGASTDMEGKYSITGIKPGDYAVKISFIGYSDKIINGVRLNKGETKVLDTKISFRSKHFI